MAIDSFPILVYRFARAIGTAFSLTRRLLNLTAFVAKHQI
jgi:hypothetical protein